MLDRPIHTYKIHFIGIGGIGISGLAKYLKAQGAVVSGSDIAKSSITTYLEGLGIPITIPHDPSALTDQEVVIHSAIIKVDNVEIVAAMEKNCVILSRKRALEYILGDKRVFSVCGAHGKSTTSAMLSALLPHFGAIIGASSKAFGSNVRESQSPSLVFEADESDQSFLSSNPYCALVTNAEVEHLEGYNYDLKAFYQAYTDFIKMGKRRVINVEDPFLKGLDLEAIRLNPSEDISHIEYFLKEDEPYTRFTLKDYGKFEVWGLGAHTAHNASLAILAALEELPLEELRKNLLDFKGIKKRFDILQKGEFVLIDDYAHHPTEIAATLQALQTYADLKGLKEAVVFWQPHKYSRLFDNLKGFQECFNHPIVSQLYILPVWRAGEAVRELDMQALFGHLQPTFIDRLWRTQEGLELFVQGVKIRTLKRGLAIGFGAGDITTQLRGEV
ncbi:UDP-N-acetylmuramate-L-alanine ligase MurC [Helicobacter sp. NHP21005]|uniref:UDP-N-acetylmuramate--L-alanine ligase n=1 Tax=Helicobacter felistomachi TaxID=3040201 RepID=UPI00257263C0|nr:UDP-N-acetylmuramate--L-alanine ligase [Helicobacter sp. NHP21005]BEG57780.1 UDP-N-acetylmuramate-L-alanine ligase MurC [Helicobacter sp. NHP21005]